MEKIWLKNYKNIGVKEEIELSDNNLLDFFERSTDKFLKLVACKSMGCNMTYKQLERRSMHFASYLQSLGLKKGDRVAIQIPNLLQFPIAYWGVIRAGLIAVNINPMYTPREIEHLLNDSQAKVVIILENFAGNLNQIIGNTKLEKVIISRVGDMFPMIKRRIINFVAKKLVSPYCFEAISFRKTLKLGKNLTYIKPEILSDDIAALQYTGGTTGVSKGASLTHKNLLANMLQMYEWVRPITKEGEEVLFTALPLYHIFAFTTNTLLAMSLGAKSVLIANPKDVSSLMKNLRKERPTIFPVVNTLLHVIYNHRDFSKIDWTNLKMCVSGGMAQSVSLAKNWMLSTDSIVIEGYGLTESSGGICCNPVKNMFKVGYVGMPIPSVDMRIYDENDNILGPNQVGEICIMGPQVMKGYWNNEEETKKVFNKDGFLKTGDIGFYDNDGFFKVIDRKKDMILVSGFNVYPNEIEEVLLSHPQILEAGVVGIEDHRSGEAIKAFIVPKDGEIINIDEIKKHCYRSLARYKVPTYFEIKKSLPKTTVGKILRRELKCSTLK